MKKIKLLIIVLTATSFFACDDYFDVNESPNDIEFTEATPARLLPGAQARANRVQVVTMNQLGNVFMNSWTRNVQSFGNGFDRELQLNIDNSFYNAIWDGLYLQLKNFDAIIKFPNPDGKYDYYQAAAKICKAHYMQYIVDLYGKSPYTDAWKGNANLTPKYDDDYATYQDLIKQLEEARALINNANPAKTEIIAPVDIMLKGNMAEWNNLANTLQLRLCLRMSNVTGAKATYRDLKMANIASGPFITNDIIVNPGFNASSDANASFAFNNFAIDVSSVARQNRTFITMTGHAYKSMQSYATTNYPAAGSQEIVPGSGVNYPDVTDPRSARLFTAGASQPFRRAVNQGSSLVDVGPPTGTYPGLPTRLGLSGNFNPYLGAPGGTIAEYSSQNTFLMTFAESRFLLAEAAIRYPSLFVGGQTYFQAGITKDFAMKNATLGTYITTINTKPNFGWIGTDNQKLHAVLYQKWIALMGRHGIESYIDYTRTGFPLTPLASNANKPRKPYRLVYPVSEYVANSSNVPAMSGDDCFAINNFAPFWLKP